MYTNTVNDPSGDSCVHFCVAKTTKMYFKKHPVAPLVMAPNHQLAHHTCEWKVATPRSLHLHQGFDYKRRCPLFDGMTCVCNETKKTSIKRQQMRKQHTQNKLCLD